MCIPALSNNCTVSPQLTKSDADLERALAQLIEFAQGSTSSIVEETIGDGGSHLLAIFSFAVQRAAQALEDP